jgi:surfeit locus 1 family protein
MSSEQARKPRAFWPMLITAFVVSVLLGLGIWQLDRLGAKEQLIDSVTRRVADAAIPLPPQSQWGTLNKPSDDFLKVSVSGEFLHDKEVYLFMLYTPPNEREPTPGHAVITPLQREDGSLVLINRGFVPESKREPQSRPQSLVKGPVTVTGLLRLPQAHSWFDADDNVAKRLFYTRDPQAMARAVGLDRVAPFVIEADATANPGGWPKGGNTVVSFANNHLQYAITWFTLALAVFGLFLIWYRQQSRPTP